MKKFNYSLLIFFCLLLASCNQQKDVTQEQGEAVDPLPSWNDASNKEAIVKFVTESTTEGGSRFIPIADRIATFDNDGTLWCEQPMYFEMIYSLDAAKQMMKDRPELAKDPKLKILTDKEAFAKNPELGIETAFAISHAGVTADEFHKKFTTWIDTTHHSRFNVPYTELIYKPMVELLQYLRKNDFKTFIVSGGSSMFIRQFSDPLYGIPAEQVIGTMMKAKFVAEDHTYKVVSTPELWHNDDKDGKPVAIQQIIGKKPVLAFGNSDGDKQMLEWTSTNTLPVLCLLLHHTDAEREYAYDSLSHIGTLKEALIESQHQGWLIVDMKKDFKTVFAFQEETNH